MATALEDSHVAPAAHEAVLPGESFGGEQVMQPFLRLPALILPSGLSCLPTGMPQSQTRWRKPVVSALKLAIPKCSSSETASFSRMVALATSFMKSCQIQGTSEARPVIAPFSA
jgi:hypothetical protein